MLTVHTLNDRICAHSNNAAHGIAVPETPLDQIEVIFERIRLILAASSMTFANVVKLTVYVTDKSILDDYFRVCPRIMDDHNPPATLLVVNKFPRPGVEIEIEATAAKAG